MSVQDFEDIFGSRVKEKKPWTLLASLCCIRLINYSCYLPGYKVTKIQRGIQSRDNKISILQKFFLDSMFELEDYLIIAVIALRYIDIGQ